MYDLFGRIEPNSKVKSHFYYYVTDVLMSFVPNRLAWRLSPFSLPPSCEPPKRIALRLWELSTWLKLAHALLLLPLLLLLLLPMKV